MPSFLAPLLRRSSASCCLQNARTHVVVADQILTAFESATRRTGLLQHAALPEGSALVIAPTNAIHTFFMRFAIDVAFVAKDGRIVKTQVALRPWRVAGALRAYAVIELPSGTLERRATRAGDYLVFVPLAADRV
jgi:uncharacterized membrane protein (UPF0127 family)